MIKTTAPWVTQRSISPTFAVKAVSSTMHWTECCEDMLSLVWRRMKGRKVLENHVRDVLLRGRGASTTFVSLRPVLSEGRQSDCCGRCTVSGSGFIYQGRRDWDGAYTVSAGRSRNTGVKSERSFLVLIHSQSVLLVQKCVFLDWHL